jgi:hypothetical protein
MSMFSLQGKNRFARLAGLVKREPRSANKRAPAAPAATARTASMPARNVAARRARADANLVALQEYVSGASPFVPLAAERERDPSHTSAQRIVDAGALARAGGPALAKPTGLAREILDAASLVRAGGHAPLKPPASSLAAQIIEAGRKRRGESDEN